MGLVIIIVGICVGIVMVVIGGLLSLVVRWWWWHCISWYVYVFSQCERDKLRER